MHALISRFSGLLSMHGRASRHVCACARHCENLLTQFGLPQLRPQVTKQFKPQLYRGYLHKAWAAYGQGLK